MDFETKSKAVCELIREETKGEVILGQMSKDGSITVYFPDKRENWVSSFSGILSQIGFNFTILSVDSNPPGEERYAVTLLFNLSELEETDFW